MPKLPEAVARAIREVRKEHPRVCTVVFFVDSRWLYFTDGNEAPAFTNAVDVGVLEAALVAVEEAFELPVAFYLPLVGD